MAKHLIRILILANVVAFVQVVWPIVAQKEREFPARGHMLALVESQDAGVLKELRAASGGKPNLAVFVNTVSTTCASGQLLYYLERESIRQQFGRVIALVPGSFTQKDAENLRRQMGLSYQVLVAEEALSREWEQLSLDYSTAAVNGLAFLFFDSGTEVWQGQADLAARLNGFQNTSPVHQTYRTRRLKR